MMTWTPRRIVVGVVALVAAALIVGVPTGVIPTPFYTRMTPVLWWNYPVTAITAVLSGLIAATYVRAEPGAKLRTGTLFGGGLLSVFAVGCPICNKLVVLALGVTGALNWFAPAQPVLAASSLLLLGYALRARLKAMRACPAPAPASAPAEAAPADRA